MGVLTSVVLYSMADSQGNIAMDNSNNLYNTDFYRWTQQQAELLRTGRLSEIDVSNILEEIESMGRSDYRAFESHLAILLMHLLKWLYQPRFQSRSWRNTVTEQRHQIQMLIKDSPSLKSKLDAVTPPAYHRAVKGAVRETGFPKATFPETCPWSFDEVMVDDFLPDTPPQ